TANEGCPLVQANGPAVAVSAMKVVRALRTSGKVQAFLDRCGNDLLAVRATKLGPRNHVGVLRGRVAHEFAGFAGRRRPRTGGLADGGCEAVDGKRAKAPGR